MIEFGSDPLQVFQGPLIVDPDRMSRKAVKHGHWSSIMSDSSYFKDFKLHVSCTSRHEAGQFMNVPQCKKTIPQGFRPGLTQTGLYSHRGRLESLIFSSPEPKAHR